MVTAVTTIVLPAAKHLRRSAILSRPGVRANRAVAHPGQVVMSATQPSNHVNTSITVERRLPTLIRGNGTPATGVRPLSAPASVDDGRGWAGR